MFNQFILSLGANKNEQVNIARATERLRVFFPHIRFSGPEYTQPVSMPSGTNPFLNRVAIAQTGKEQAEVKRILKEIETEIGRLPEDKGTFRIPIDIDLLQWNETPLKPADLKREYISRALRLLLAEGENDERG